MAKKLVRFDWAINERLDEMKLNEKDAKAYKKYLKNLRDIASDQYTKMVDAQDLIKKGEEKKEIETVLKFHQKGMTDQEIAELLDIPMERIRELIGSQSNK